MRHNAVALTAVWITCLIASLLSGCAADQSGSRAAERSANRPAPPSPLLFDGMSEQQAQDACVKAGLILKEKQWKVNKNKSLVVAQYWPSTADGDVIYFLHFSSDKLEKIEPISLREYRSQQAEKTAKDAESRRMSAMVDELLRERSRAAVEEQAEARAMQARMSQIHPGMSRQQAIVVCDRAGLEQMGMTTDSNSGTEIQTWGYSFSHTSVPLRN
jgi:hypothetical protein